MICKFKRFYLHYYIVITIIKKHTIKIVCFIIYFFLVAKDLADCD